MATPNVWYPEGLRFVNSDIVQLTDCTPAYNYSDYDERLQSDYGPGFVGATQASPDISFRTRQMKDVLDECDVADVAAGLHEDGVPSPYTVRLYCRGGVPFGTRAASDAPTEHHVIDMVNSAFLTWESITAEQGNAAEMQCRLNVAAQADQQSQDPYVWTGTVPDPLPLTVSHQHVYTLGPVKIAELGGFIGGVTSVRWDNNIQREEQISDGDVFPTFQAIREMMPTCTITTTNIGLLDTFVTTNKRGLAVVNPVIFFSHMNRNQIRTPHATATHISLTMPLALATVRQLSNNPAEIEIQLKAYKTAITELLFTANTATAIS